MNDRNDKKNKIATIIVLVLFLGLSFFWIFTGIKDLNGLYSAKTLNTDDDLGVEIYAKIDNFKRITDLFEIEHRVNHFFKTGTDYYVLMTQPNAKKLFVAVVSKKLFDDMHIEHKLLVEEKREIKGKLIVPNKRIKTEIDNVFMANKLGKIKEYVYPYYFDTMAETNSFIKLATGLLFLIIIVHIYFIRFYYKKSLINSQDLKEAKTNKKGFEKIILSKPALVVLVVALLVSLGLLFTKSHILFPTKSPIMINRK